MSSPYGQPPDEQPEQPAQQPTYGQQPQQPYGQTPYGQQPAQSPYGQPAQAGRPGPNGLTPDEMMWGGAAHWGALVSAFLAMGFLGPLIVLLVKGNQSPYIRAQAVESLNFQISVLIYAAISFVLLLVLAGLILLPLVGLFWLVFTIVGSIKSVNGEVYRYPLTIRMVS